MPTDSINTVSDKRMCRLITAVHAVTDKNMKKKTLQQVTLETQQQQTLSGRMPSQLITAIPAVTHEVEGHGI